MLNLGWRNWYNNSSEGYKAQQTRGLQHRLPRLERLIDMHERISRKQWNRDHLLPITPAVAFGPQREVHFEALVVKLRGDFFLEAVPCLNRKPLRQVSP